MNQVKELTHQNNAVLVFDEIVTGFRFCNGGAQKYFDVTPDLATFGKGMANGFPLSALVGRKEIMKLLEEVFFSFTFGGETLSLAASKVVLTKLIEYPILKEISVMGEHLIAGVNRIISDLQLNNMISISGHPSWTFLNYFDINNYSKDVIKTYYLQELFKRGILCIGTHNLSHSHTPEDINTLLDVYREIFEALQLHIKNEALECELQCDILKPLFSVRTPKNTPDLKMV